MTVIELPDEEVAALRAKASAAGLTLEAWLEQLADVKEEPPSERPVQTAAEIVLSRMRSVPPEIMATMPEDGASQHDHYIYGWPKREVRLPSCRPNTSFCRSTQLHIYCGYEEHNAERRRRRSSGGAPNCRRKAVDRERVSSGIPDQSGPTAGPRANGPGSAA